MKISAVVPTYNGANYINRAVDSILEQSRPVDEIIVVDDGSTDDTAERLAHYGDRLRVLRLANGGPARARNQGLQLATHPWVALLDADDWWLPSKIEQQAALVERDSQLDLIYTGICVMLPGGHESEIRTATPPAQLWPGLRYANSITPSTVLVRRDLVLEAGGFDETLRGVEDWELWVRLGPDVRYGAIAEPLTYYQLTPGSLSSQMESESEFADLIAHKTLMNGLTGLERALAWRRLTSAQLFRASVASRHVDASQSLSYLYRSLSQWPSPTFMPERWKSLLLEGKRVVLGK